ncbi:MAG TPA: hypothetical protein VMQ62_06250, partial [Dongiaceae bacterium]|nr:hypothetical protein [Dongiaceae bacterium]
CGGETAGVGARYLRAEGTIACARCGARRPGDVALPSDSLEAATAIVKRAPAAFVGTPPPRDALRPLAALAAAVFEEVAERRFRSYEVLEQLRRPPAAPPRER